MWYRSSSFSDFKSKSQGGEMNKMLCAAVFASAAVFSGSANAQSADAKMSFFITSVGSGKGAQIAIARRWRSQPAARKNGALISAIAARTP
jgi:hypothetical protein